MYQDSLLSCVHLVVGTEMAEVIRYIAVVILPFFISRLEITAS